MTNMLRPWSTWGLASLRAPLASSVGLQDIPDVSALSRNGDTPDVEVLHTQEVYTIDTQSSDLSIVPALSSTVYTLCPVVHTGFVDGRTNNYGKRTSR